MPALQLIEAQSEHIMALQRGTAPTGLTLVPDNVGSPEVLTMLANLAETFGATFAPCAWMIVDHGEIVGLMSVVRAPEPGSIHIGYGVAPARRNQGVATQAVAALIQWARADVRLDRITADISIENVASQKVLLRNGFKQIGARIDDEDGPLICWEAAVR